LEFTGEKKGKSYGQWKSDQKEKEGKIRTDVSWYDLIRDDIDQAVSSCATFEEFLEKLSDSGYEIRLGKYLSLRPYAKERAVRSSRLGPAYTIDAIRERLPKTRIFLLAYYPCNPDAVADGAAEVFRFRTNERIDEANRGVQALAERCGAEYLDLNAGLKDEAGRLKAEFTIEGIHMFADGYREVLDALLPTLKSLR
jgi:hypothetical protein